MNVPTTHVLLTAAAAAPDPAMPKLPRVVISGVPMHITQRGVDRCPTFRCDEDFAYYRWALREAIQESACALHAYALMTNHVHLLVTPSDVTGPASLFRSLGRRYVRHFNSRHRRTGTLWEGRYRSGLVESVAYLFTCIRYIEMNPVRAGIAAEPRGYAWSSYHHNADGRIDPLLSEHSAYEALGADGESRRAAYRSMLSATLAPDAIAHIRASQLSRVGTGRPSGALAVTSRSPRDRTMDESTAIAAAG